jgi:hypothetical protein
MVEVGRLRKEKRKWIHAFSDVSLIFFFVNYSGYRRNLFEDESVSQFEESITMIEDLLNNRYLNSIPILLILSMSDLFEESLSDFYKFEKDYDSSMTPKEFLISKIRSNLSELKVTIFETCGFDRDRNNYLLELAQKKINGEILEEYYPYFFSFLKKYVMSSKLFDVHFCFSKDLE